ncbi:MAG: type II toxin-antitoxin system VapC family toxin [Deltaproteobacteria bacterium]|nr:type II toxin-antitoxin system VapC family toxin [Deltaproteobacteria bacterium]MBI3391009.1 type II toxin-antitoxin system VapC family toxin [Deltaproteobacteria bacterium]
MLLDSNIIIYAAQPEQGALRAFVEEKAPAVSVISRIEVLGYHQLQQPERESLDRFFEAAEVLPLSESVVERAVHLRIQRRMSLGDSIIAATALVHQLTLVTHNTEDFAWIRELRLLDPLTSKSKKGAVRSRTVRR